MPDPESSPPQRTPLRRSERLHPPPLRRNPCFYGTQNNNRLSIDNPLPRVPLRRMPPCNDRVVCRLFSAMRTDDDEDATDNVDGDLP